jgi:hypothetical protein
LKLLCLKVSIGAVRLSAQCLLLFSLPSCCREAWLFCATLSRSIQSSLISKLNSNHDLDPCYTIRRNRAISARAQDSIFAKVPAPIVTAAGINKGTLIGIPLSARCGKEAFIWCAYILHPWSTKEIWDAETMDVNGATKALARTGLAPNSSLLISHRLAKLSFGMHSFRIRCMNHCVDRLLRIPFTFLWKVLSISERRALVHNVSLYESLRSVIIDSASLLPILQGPMWAADEGTEPKRFEDEGYRSSKSFQWRNWHSDNRGSFPTWK